MPAAREQVAVRTCPSAVRHFLDVFPALRMYICLVFVWFFGRSLRRRRRRICFFFCSCVLVFFCFFVDEGEVVGMIS